MPMNNRSLDEAGTGHDSPLDRQRRQGFYEMKLGINTLLWTAAFNDTSSGVVPAHQGLGV